MQVFPRWTDNYVQGDDRAEIDKHIRLVPDEFV
jgi:hypothetical protein